MPSILEMIWVGVCVCVYLVGKKQTVIWEEKWRKFLKISGRAFRMEALEHMRQVNRFECEK